MDADLPLQNSRSQKNATVRHLYVHIPFCARICPYCAFYKTRPDPSQTQTFCEAVLRELERYLTDFDVAPTTIFFGGGTPTSLAITQLQFLLGGFRDRLDLSQLVEWTIEANPGSVSERKAAVLKNFGVNRISLGVQSWDDGLLNVLGREHNALQAEESFRSLRNSGFTNVNVDLMFGLPGQTVEQWCTTLKQTIALEPEHISTYCLTYEEDTEFFLRHSRGELRSDSDQEADFFLQSMSTLQDARYQHYEISNYARQNYSSAHNRAYWSGADYLGIGPSAFSTVGLKRWQDVPDYRAYSQRVLSGESAISSIEELTRDIKRGEQIALGLRTSSGVPTAMLEHFRVETEEFLSLGLLERRNGSFVLTHKGKSVADSVAEAFI